MRILVAGGPRVGKTTLAAELAQKHGIIPQHTDDLIGTHAWSDASCIVADWFVRDSFIIEGVAVVRALRKWLDANPDGSPADVLYLRPVVHVPLTPAQRVMAKGHETIWSSVAPRLRARRLEIVTI